MAGKNDGTAPIIVRRIKKGGHGGHHGGAWKIAYADFVTAMMAFFLLMWLLGSTTKAEKQGISDYFNTPLSVAMAGQGSGGSQSSILNAGGRDLTSTEKGDGRATQPMRTSARPGAQPTAALPRSMAATKEDQARLMKLKATLSALIERNPKLSAFRDQIRIDLTSEGLRIEIVDSRNRPMFASGSQKLEGYAQDILEEIAGPLNDVNNRVSIAGHTDAVAYSGGNAGYSNWELSSERANAARRALSLGGMKEDKILQVRGLADALPLNKNVADEPANRRISILVLNKAAEDAFFRDGGRVTADTAGPASDPAANVAETILQSAASKAASAAAAAASKPGMTTAAAPVAGVPTAAQALATAPAPMAAPAPPMGPASQPAAVAPVAHLASK